MLREQLRNRLPQLIRLGLRLDERLSQAVADEPRAEVRAQRLRAQRADRHRTLNRRDNPHHWPTRLPLLPC